MNCHHINLGGQAAIICGDFHDLQPACQCGAPGAFLCDWRLGKSDAHTPARTCDRRICDKHAQEVGPDKHLCPEHQATYAKWLAAHPELGGAA